MGAGLLGEETSTQPRSAKWAGLYVDSPKREKSKFHKAMFNRYANGVRAHADGVGVKRKCLVRHLVGQAFS
jgi:hypothetical protein